MATSIECPECRREIAIQPSSAGRFRSRCPECSAIFTVTVPEGEAGRPMVEPSKPTLPGERPDLIRASEASPSLADHPEPIFHPPQSLGGYRVGRPLGSFRAGASFEARRKSTGRSLALAVLRPRWSAEPTFVARFAREAFASELLNHPNLIVPVELGVDRGFGFVASDSLAGEALSEPRGREGFDRTARLSSILHAARGLRHAHEQGIYHRDLSLEKIRIDSSGLVRLAEVGLGLTPQTPESPGIAAIPLAGSPSTPPPEPLSAGFVREDIAGLGRTLHILVGGERGDRALTPGLASVVRRMLGEGQEGGYRDLGAVVRALEAELGVGGTFLPRDEEASEFEACARAFDEAPLAEHRPKLSPGFAAMIAAFVLLTLLLGKPLNALGTLAFGALVAASTIAIRGSFGRDPLFDRARELLLGGTRGDLLTIAAGLLLILASLAATGLLGFWIFLVLLAVGLPLAFFFAVDRPIELARADSITRASTLIRGLRRLGVDEDSIRRFACRQAGVRWEEFFETLFGYDALRSARLQWGLDAGGRRRPRFARWRDPIIDAIDARLRARREVRDRALFEAIEERNLEARGVNLVTARRKSRRIAEAIVTFGRNYGRPEAVEPGPPLMDALNRVALRPDDYLTTVELEEPTGPPLWREALEATSRVLFGARTRFLLGGVLLAGFLIWMHQNALINADEIRQAGQNATVDREKAVADAREIGRKVAANVQGVADASTRTRSLELAGLPPTLARRLDGFGLGVAALILILSACVRGLRIAVFAIPGALIATLGPHLIEPGARPLGPTSLVALALGAGLFALGLLFGRTRD